MLQSCDWFSHDGSSQDMNSCGEEDVWIIELYCQRDLPTPPQVECSLLITLNQLQISTDTVSSFKKHNIMESILLKVEYVLCIYLKLSLMALICVLKQITQLITLVITLVSFCSECSVLCTDLTSQPWPTIVELHFLKKGKKGRKKLTLYTSFCCQLQRWENVAQVSGVSARLSASVRGQNCPVSDCQTFPSVDPYASSATRQSILNCD